jgi:hypothetical protein
VFFLTVFIVITTFKTISHVIFVDLRQFTHEPLMTIHSWAQFSMNKGDYSIVKYTLYAQLLSRTLHNRKSSNMNVLIQCIIHERLQVNVKANTQIVLITMFDLYYEISHDK